MTYKSIIFKAFNGTLILLFFLTSSCGIYKPADARKIDPNVNARVQKNIEEGRGFRVMGGKKKGGGTFEFASSNEMWRASIDLLDFTPFSNVDYSGGIIITDWFSDENSSKNESLKITVRFLSNEIRSESLKVVIHQKKCSTNQACKINLVSNSILIDELQSSILRKAAQIDAEQRKKKK